MQPAQCTKAVMEGPMDDMAKMRMYMDIDRRYLMAMPKIMPGQASKEVIREFEEILADYQKLLIAGPPQFSFYKIEDVQLKIADVTESIARTNDSLRQDDQARVYYEKAIRAYEELGQIDKANRCRAILAQAIHSIEGDVDEELNRLRSNLEAMPPDTLEHVEALVALAELYSSQEDDFEAEALLLKAESELQRIGYSGSTGPSGTEMADALKATMDSILSGKGGSGPTQIEIKLKARDLYRRIYLVLSQIYREKDVTQAGKYMRLLKDMDGKLGEGNRIQQDFVDQMSNSPSLLLDELDKFSKE
jgi:tetratricopeptide (TPR) repeat protein